MKENGLIPLFLVIALIASGCAVGPDFKQPPPPKTDGYTSETLPEETQSINVAGGEPQRFDYGGELRPDWWTLFGSSQLNALIDEATRIYPTVQAQQAALREARQNVRAEQGNLFPQVQGSANRTREKVPGTILGLPGVPGFLTTLYAATAQVSYTFDVFGGERRAIEGFEAQVDYAHYKLEGSYLALISNLVAAAIRAASARDQITTTQDIIASEERQLNVIERRFQLGGVTQADLLSEQAQLGATRATLPGLQQALSEAQHEIAILTGHSPRDLAPVSFTLADFRLPQDVPVSLPSSLVRQRPDIRAQEALLHRASADIGVATANMLPQITLNATYGGASTDASQLLQSKATIWSLAGGITQPIFQGGTLLAKRRGAVAAFDEAWAEYQTTVLTAFQNVADSLTALDNDAQALKGEYQSSSAAQASLDFAERQYAGGAATYLALLTQQQQYQQARLGYVRALASRYLDTVTLFHALGGDWFDRDGEPKLRAASDVR